MFSKSFRGGFLSRNVVAVGIPFYECLSFTQVKRVNSMFYKLCLCECMEASCIRIWLKPGVLTKSITYHGKQTACVACTTVCFRTWKKRDCL